MSAALVALFNHHRWATVRLIEACMALEAPTLAATVEGTYGTIADTLYHLIANEERYLKTIAGEPLNGDPHRTTDLQALRDRAERCGAQWVVIAREMDPDTVLRGEWRGEPYAIPLTVILTQALAHGAEHRTQITTILTQQGITPPDLSGWAYGSEVQAGRG